MEPVLIAGASTNEDNAEVNPDTDIYKSVCVLPEAPTKVCDTGESSSGMKRKLNISSNPIISCMALNDSKAGMEGLDREKINNIIHEASKGSKFYENEKKKEEILNIKIKEQRTLVESISASQLQFGCHQADQLLRELEETRDLSRTIVHVDMDAFYAAVEMRDDPSLKSKPMAVGSMSMLCTSNYMARRFGVRAAMPGFIGRKLCPELVIIPPNFEKYIAVSNEVRQIMALYDPNFVPASLDEAYLDFTEHLKMRINSPSSSRTFLVRTNNSRNSLMCACDLNLVLRHLVLQEDCTSHNLSVDEMKTSANLIDPSKVPSQCFEREELKICSFCQKHFPPFTVKIYGVNAEEAVLEMRNCIEQRTQLTASAGIAPNTMLAKVCSDKNKPNGQFRIESTKQMVEQFIMELPVRKISGIGRVTEKLLEALGVLTCSALYKQRGLLYHVFTAKTFHHFMSIALGIGSSTVESDGERKSMSTEQTFGDLVHPEELFAKCQELCNYLARDLKREKLLGKSVTLKIKTVAFEVKTRTNTINNYSNDDKAIFKAAKQLLEAEILAQQPDCLRLRLMGIKISKLLSQADFSVPVSSYFEKPGNKNVVKSESVTDCTSPTKDKYQDLQFTVYSESINVTSTLPNISVHQPSMTIPQNVFPLNDDNEFQFPESFPEKIAKSESPKLPNVSTETKRVNNKLPLCMKTKLANKHGTNSDFLYSKVDNCQLVERNCDSYCDSQLGINKTSGYSDALTNEHVKHNKSVINKISFVDIPSGCPSSSDNFISLHFPVTTDSHKQTLSPTSRNMRQLPSTSSGLVVSADTPHSHDMIQCPICGQQKYQWPLDQLNTHVDLCLSRSTVRDILLDQQSQHLHSSVSKKRSWQQDETKQGHKHSKNQRTLLSFFKQ